MRTLGDAYPEEQARCRELLVAYRKIGPPGLFAATMLEELLGRADRAAIDGDIVKMIQLFHEMRDFK